MKRGFTVLELLVAISVTALLAAMLFNITTQVSKTQAQSSADLETNQVAQYILDRIQEDLQCAIYQNDGNLWMAATVLIKQDDKPGKNSDSWSGNFLTNTKPQELSLRINVHDLEVPNAPALNNQLNIEENRFGVRGVWLRFFTQAPELDPEVKSSGGARAVSYQIVRHGLLGDSDTAMPRYQLFRSDVSDENTLKAGFNHIPLFPGRLNNLGNVQLDSIYGEKSDQNGYRTAELIHNPIIQNADTISPTAFSIAANVVDFGIRAYVMKNNRHGTGYLKQIFPDKNSRSEKEYEFLASSHPAYRLDDDPDMNAFPHVVDIMVRILTSEGASALASFERGAFPTPSNFDGGDAAYWWEIVEKNSEVFTRRIRIFANGV